MVDIETMGNVSYSSILSIGAVEFDIETGNTGKEFNVNIDLQSCLDIGLVVNASTIIWWMQQSEQARKDITQANTISIKEALNEFSKFCNMDYEIWARSPRFDCGRLQDAYNKLKMDIPWDFKKERCVRTYEFNNPKIKENYEFSGTAHNTIDDCKFQIGYCSKIYQYLNEK